MEFLDLISTSLNVGLMISEMIFADISLNVGLMIFKMIFANIGEKKIDNGKFAKLSNCQNY